MTQTIRILIVDDHKLVREGLKAFIASLPGYEILGEARDGVEAIEQAARLAPDVILLDLLMPRMDGIAATREIMQANPSARILIITSFAEEEKVIAAIKAGARGCLLKDSSPQELQNAIREIYAGKTIFPVRIARLLSGEPGFPPVTPPKVEDLTGRELEILRMVAKGLTNQEIATRLELSIWTVRTHLTAILAKLQLENRTQAALYAIRLGLIPAGD